MPLISSETSFFSELITGLAVFEKQTVVIKIGGNAIYEDPDFLDLLGKQLAFLQKHNVKIVLVHGGGPQIDDALAKAGLTLQKRADGRRPTSASAIAVVETVLLKMSESIAATLKKHGCAVYAAADTGRLFVTAKPFKDELKDSENRAGTPDKVDRTSLCDELNKGKIIVLHSLAKGPGDLLYNINADDYAMAVAMAVAAKRLILATNVNGVNGSDDRVIDRLTPTVAQALFANGTITGGMIPKVESALRVLETGVGGVAIVNAHHPWVVLKELLTYKGLGTLIVPDEGPSIKAPPP